MSSIEGMNIVLLLFIFVLYTGDACAASIQIEHARSIIYDLVKTKKNKDINFKNGSKKIIQGWEERLGVGSIESEIDKWSSNSIESSKDSLDKGLGLFWLKKYREAATTLIRYAEYQRFKDFYKQDKLRIIQAYRLSADMFLFEGVFNEALRLNRLVLSIINKDQRPDLWVEVMLDIVYLQIELIPVDKQNTDYISANLNRISEYYSKVDQLSAWANVRNLISQTRIDVSEPSDNLRILANIDYGIMLLKKTEQELRYSRYPELWITTEIILGRALYLRGLHSDGDSGLDILKQSERAYRLVLSSIDKEKTPWLWAMEKNHLANVLSELGVRIDGVEGIELLEQAVFAYRESLLIISKKNTIDLAIIKNNIAIALQNLGSRINNSDTYKLLNEAKNYFVEALSIYRVDKYPKDWSMIHNNLGVLLSTQGDQLQGSKRMEVLDKAIEHYKKALSVRTLRTMPIEWAMTQNNLGNVLVAKGKKQPKDDRAKSYEMAIKAYKKAVTIFTEKFSPQNYYTIIDMIDQINAKMTK